MGKSSLNKWLLGLAVVQIGLVAFLWSGKDKTSNAMTLLLDDVDEQKATKVVVASSGETLEFAKKDGSWVVTNHFDVPVKENTMVDALIELKRIQARSPMSSNQNRHDQLGVAAGKFNRKVDIWEGEAKRTLWIGNSAGGRRHSLRLGDEPNVYAATGVQVATWSTSLSTWVDVKLFDGNVSKVQSVEVTKSDGKKFQFDKNEEGSWVPLRLTESGPVEIKSPSKHKEFQTSMIDGMVSSGVNMRMEKPADPSIAIENPIHVRVVLAAEDPKEGEAISPITPEVAFSVGQENEKGERLLVREGKRPVWVTAYSVNKVVDFKEDKLWKDPSKEAPTPPAGMPNPGSMPQGMPPGMFPQMPH